MSSWARCVSLIVAAALHACGGARTTDPSTAVPGNEPEPWFCQMSEQGGWSCIRDAEMAADPKPERLPEPVALPGRESSNVPAMVRDEPAAALAVLQRAEDAPASPVPPPAPATSQAPAYQRLAYQPDHPTRLVELPGHFYAVQLIAMPSKETLEAFITSRRLTGMSAARVTSGSEIFYVLLLGVYPDRASAELAAEERPPPLQELTPWVRKLESLQRAVLEADALTGTTEF